MQVNIKYDRTLYKAVIRETSSVYLWYDLCEKEDGDGGIKKGYWYFGVE